MTATSSDALKVPVINVAAPKWSFEKLHDHLRASIKRAGGFDNQRVFERRLQRCEHIYGNQGIAGRPTTTGALPGHPAFAVRDPDQRPWRGSDGREYSDCSKQCTVAENKR